MPIDLPPERPGLWLSPKPAIIRAWKREALSMASFLPGMFPAAVAAGGAPQAVFPELLTTGSQTTTTGTTIAVPVPTGTVAGDLLMLYVSVFSDGATTFSSLSGWSNIYDAVGSGDLRRYGAWRRTATGSEGSTVTVTVSRSSSVAAIMLRISSFTGDPISGTNVTGNNASPDPPSRAPGLGVKKFLWIAVAHVHFATTTNTFTGDPSNYGSGAQAISVVAGKNTAAVRATVRQLEADTEDPGAYSITATRQWACSTIAVEGAPA